MQMTHMKNKVVYKVYDKSSEINFWLKDKFNPTELLLFQFEQFDCLFTIEVGRMFKQV